MRSPERSSAPMCAADLAPRALDVAAQVGPLGDADVDVADQLAALRAHDGRLLDHAPRARATPAARAAARRRRPTRTVVSRTSSSARRTSSRRRGTASGSAAYAHAPAADAHLPDLAAADDDAGGARTSAGSTAWRGDRLGIGDERRGASPRPPTRRTRCWCRRRATPTRAPPPQRLDPRRVGGDDADAHRRRTPVDSMSMRARMGAVQALLQPGSRADRRRPARRVVIGRTPATRHRARA